jgi:hypothetical protein
MEMNSESELSETYLAPPPRPVFKGLSTVEANELRREWERLMYRYLDANGGNYRPCPAGPVRGQKHDVYGIQA